MSKTRCAGLTQVLVRCLGLALILDQDNGNQVQVLSLTSAVCAKLSSGLELE